MGNAKLKLTEDNTGENLGDPGYGGVFVNAIPKAQSTKERPKG